MPKFETFKDVSVTFKKHPVTDDLIVVKNKSAIQQSIRSLLLTQKGERPFQPELGSDIYRLLFEPMDYGTAALIQKAIFEVIGNYEPRISVDTVMVSPSRDDNGFNVELSYAVIGRDDTPVNVEFFLESSR
tara:strand:+ start:270 stop:662 length:393 start_codon:yes stop_codon:yes gene_type:complete